MIAPRTDPDALAILDLLRYAQHLDGCAAWGRLGRRGASRHAILPERCDCGLAIALADAAMLLTRDPEQ